VTLFINNNAAILEYTASRYIPVSDGTAVIFDSYNVLAHTTNLTNFIAIVKETEKLVELFPASHMRKFLEVDLNEITKSVNSLLIHHRQARSLNFIGTALKYIAGTPDYDDLNQIHIVEGELISSNNKQIVINSEIQNKINNLTQTVNLLLNVTKKSDINGGHLYDLLANRNREILRELDNLAMSVALGKAQIINPVLLDVKEIDFILKSENNTNVTISEIIANSKLKILQSKDILTFLIKFPIIKFVCKKQIIFPVIHDNKLLSFESDTIAKCPNKYIVLKSNCKKKTSISFCQSFVHKDNFCLKNLLNENAASCNTIPAHNMPTVNLVDDGIVIINDQPATILEQNKTKTLQKGTFLITFQNEITVNATKFSNLRKIAFMSPESPAAHHVNLSDHISLLSLPYLHGLNIENRDYISQLHFAVRSTVYSFISVIALLTIAAAIFLMTKRQRKFQFADIIRRFNQTGTSDTQRGE